MATTRLKRIEQQRKIFKISISLAGIFILISAFIFIGRLWGFYDKIHTEAKTTNHPKEQPKDEFTILLLGYGGGKHEGTYLTDTIMVLNINIKTNKVLLVSIPRDIWVKVPTDGEKFHAKINSVYQMGLFPEDYPALDKKLISKDWFLEKKTPDRNV